MTPTATVSKVLDEGNSAGKTTAAGDPGATGIVEQTTAEPTETLEGEPTETFELESGFDEPVPDEEPFVE